MKEQIKQLVREHAMTKFASEEEVNTFMEGFEKEAGFSGQMGKYITNGGANDVILKAALGLGAALAGVGVVKGINSASSMASNYQLRGKFDLALSQVMANNRVVKDADPVRAKSYAETIFKFAPHVASDPNLLSSILANSVLGEGVDSQTIKSLTDLEGRYKENNSSQPLTGIRV
jgi:hypothetical protein